MWVSAVILAVGYKPLDLSIEMGWIWVWWGYGHCHPAMEILEGMNSGRDPYLEQFMPFRAYPKPASQGSAELHALLCCWVLVNVRMMDLHKHLFGPKEAEEQDKDELH